MYSRIFGEIINADLHSARSNAIEIGDEKLISLIERLMYCDVEDYKRYYCFTLIYLNMLKDWNE